MGLTGSDGGRRRPAGSELRAKLLVAILAAALPIRSVLPDAAVAPPAPYGVAEERAQRYDVVDTVLDVQAHDPSELHGLADAVREIADSLKGRIVVVIDGRASALFARINYARYRALIDQLALQARRGVQFRVARGALAAQGYSATDLHGFVTVIASRLADTAQLQDKGYRYTRFASAARPGVGPPAEDDRREQEPRLKFEY